MHLIYIRPLTGTFEVSQADISFEIACSRVQESLANFPFYLEAEKSLGLDYLQKATDKALSRKEWPVFCTEAQEFADRIAEFLNDKFPANPLPWNEEEMKRFQIALECLSFATKNLQ